jgi:hypothetical protein
LRRLGYIIWNSSLPYLELDAKQENAFTSQGIAFTPESVVFEAYSDSFFDPSPLINAIAQTSYPVGRQAWRDVLSLTQKTFISDHFFPDFLTLILHTRLYEECNQSSSKHRRPGTADSAGQLWDRQIKW